MLTGGTGKEASRSIMGRLTSWTPQSAEKEIKLCYVTVSPNALAAEASMLTFACPAREDRQEQRVRCTPT